MSQNNIGLQGIEFVEFATNRPGWLTQLFYEFGFSLLKKHAKKNIHFFQQNRIQFLLNAESESHGGKFAEDHGPSACSMGWRFADAENAFQMALSKGAKAATLKDYDVPAVVGIGGCLIYFIDSKNLGRAYEGLGFESLEKPVIHPEKGFAVVDHLTNNVYKGTMDEWSDYYRKIFEFTDVRYFDIKGNQTGLTSYALRSPCGTFCIPINEAAEKKSQINEYLDQYNGPGIQHIAFLTNNILSSLQKMENSSVQMLDIDHDYYKMAFERSPNVKEDHKEIMKRNVLVDGDENGYLLQIFTKNIIGPIFFEMIQRENNLTFGEGNFTALFKSIEKDQEKRGVFKT